ncbi:50S ribosomal protein L15 [Mycoplasma zalophi]|uniref:Large ribosomal subunit protein uL15 n=1 Tax=Mycoplasma zalophi TaxID=191287 RepID=A0ABS6DQH5_9MOLU|nr:50S ribosomal protein L15 [Mycoplasma zalophi]MBU4691344.1 50S ribosomal protein L15 [Mycoplasma zalophi]MBU4692570.1 50S ribosomal protein L15 [Mycoplasma zalophi]MCU4117285.1 50S ribosomal protein L15 [Mycoplasma zalophi]
MQKLNNLKYTEGARKDKHRVGRGHAAGKGKQAGRGQSGQTKRNNVRLGFEGGQNPWFRRLPKRGFKNVNHIEFQVVNLDQLEIKFEKNETVSFETLFNKGLIKHYDQPVKILGRGEITKPLVLTDIDKISKTAEDAIVKAGGKIEVE